MSPTDIVYFAHINGKLNMIYYENTQACQHVCIKYYKVLIHTIFVDINECKKTPSPCDQLCRNDKGSFQCYCKDGYELNETTLLCQSEF